MCICNETNNNNENEANRVRKNCRKSMRLNESTTFCSPAPLQAAQPPSRAEQRPAIHHNVQLLMLGTIDYLLLAGGNQHEVLA
jgi:hypothetical protein